MVISTIDGQSAAVGLIGGAAQLAPTRGGVTGSDAFGPATVLALGSSGDSFGGYSALAPVDLSAAYQARLGQPTAALPLSGAAEATLAQVAQLLEDGALDEARAVAAELRAAYPQSGQIVHALGAIELQERNYSAAQQLFEQSHYLAPDQGYDEDAQVARWLQEDDATALHAARRMLADDETAQTARQLLVGLTHRSPLLTAARVLLAEELLRQQDVTNGLAQYRLAIATADTAQLGAITARLEQFVEAVPESAYVRSLLGEAQLRQGANEAAAQTLAIAAELGDEAARYRQAEAAAHLAVGHDKLAAGDVAGALASFETARGLDASNADVRLAFGAAYLARAREHLQLGQLASAAGDVQAGARKLGTADDAELRAALARTAYDVGVALDAHHQRRDESSGEELALLRSAWELEPTNRAYRAKLASVSLRAGAAYMAEENYRDAAVVYRRAADLYPHHPAYRQQAAEAYGLWGAAALDDYQFNDAVTAYAGAYEYQHTAARRLDLAAAYDARGMHYVDAGSYAKALSDFRSALKYDPDNSAYRDHYEATAAH